MHMFLETLPQRLRQVPSILVSQQSGIAFLTMVPFMLSSITLAQRDPTFLFYLTTTQPQSYTVLPALLLAIIATTVLVKSRSLLSLATCISAIVLLALALKAVVAKTQIGQQENISAVLAMIENGSAYPDLYGLYSVSVFATVLGVIVRPTLSQWLFRTVAFVLVADVILFTFSSAFTVLGSFFIRYTPSQVSVLTSLLVLLFLRMVVKFVQENMPYLNDAKALSPDVRQLMLRNTFSLWWPMLAVFVVCGVTYHWLDERYVKQPLIRALNSYELENEVRVYPTGTPISPPTEARNSDTVETASIELLDYFLEQQNAQIAARIDAQVDTADNTADGIVAEVRAALPRRFPGTAIKDCGLLDADCHLANIAKAVINSGYVSARRATLNRLQGDLERASQGAEDVGTSAKDEVGKVLAGLNDLTRRFITETATGLRYLGWAAFAYSVVILAKSLMIVLARVFHSQVATTPAASGLAGDRRIGKMKRLGARVELRAADGISHYYVVFKACGNNVIDRRRIPQPTKLVLRRLFARNLTMCLIDFDADKSIATCDLIVDPPAEITQWDLLEDDEIFVDMANVLGFSRSCRLDRRISMSLGALIFGRAIYHSISGPGRVYLRTENAPLAGADKGTWNVMQASSLVAWRRDTGFHVKSSLTVGDTFFSGYSIRKADERGHLVLYDTSQTRRVGTGGGILRMTRAFLLPF